MKSLEAVTVSSQASGAQQVRRTGAFDLDCRADIAFPLFSPEGERLWIKEWNPRPIFPDTIAFQADTVFRQGEGVQQAVWTILDVDWQRHRAEYVRLAPASHAARIVVQIDAHGHDACRVCVSYTLTVFGQDAASLLESFSVSAFAEKMQNWQRWTSEYLGTEATQ